MEQKCWKQSSQAQADALILCLDQLFSLEGAQTFTERDAVELPLRTKHCMLQRFTVTAFPTVIKKWSHSAPWYDSLTFN